MIVARPKTRRCRRCPDPGAVWRRRRQEHLLGAPGAALHHEKAALGRPAGRAAGCGAPVMPVVRPVVQQLGATIDGGPGVVVVVVSKAPAANALKVSLGADAGDEAEANVAGGRGGAGVDGRAGPAAAVPLEQRGRGGRADAVGAAADGGRRRWRP